MDQENNQNSIKNHLFEAIKNGELTMRPRWHFIFKTVFATIGAFVVLLTLLYIVSFILSGLRESGVLFVPVFGYLGWLELFRYLPWILILTSVFLLILLEVLVRYFSFGQRQPVLYTALGIIIFVLMGGVLAEPYHRTMFRDAHGKNQTVMGGFYKNFGIMHSPNTHVGFIFATTSEGFTLEGQNEEVLNVVINADTRFPLGIEFSKGDMVVVFGGLEDNTIEAKGIREVNNEFAPNSKYMHEERRVFRF